MKETESKGSINRRGFLELAGYGAAIMGFYSLWKWNYNVQRDEELRQMNEWEPAVANLLRETIESDKLDNLKVLTEIARPQFIDLVSRSKEALLSPIPDSNNGARYDLLAFALGEHYGLKLATHSEGGTTLFDEDTLSFLDRTMKRVDPQRIRDRKIENQANMWVEAVYRSYAAAWQLDPTIKDGVYLPDNQYLLGRSLTPRNRFVRLQSHS
jgi:hypothetical protein